MSDEWHNPGREPGRESRRERFDDLKEAYALGALSKEERQEVEDYLRTHPELRAEVDDLRSVANLRWLSLGLWVRSPSSATLKSKEKEQERLRWGEAQIVALVDPKAPQDRDGHTPTH